MNAELQIDENQSYFLSWHDAILDMKYGSIVFPIVKRVRLQYIPATNAQLHSFSSNATRFKINVISTRPSYAFYLLIWIDVGCITNQFLFRSELYFLKSNCPISAYTFNILTWHDHTATFPFHKTCRLWVSRPKRITFKLLEKLQRRNSSLIKLLRQ